MITECAVTCDMLISYLNLIGLCSIASEHTLLPLRVVFRLIGQCDMLSDLTVTCDILILNLKSAGK